jgi:hypothetical protein
MTPYQTYQLWQIERRKTTAEQLDLDAQHGMLIAAASRSARQAARTTAQSATRVRKRVARGARLAGWPA